MDDLKFDYSKLRGKIRELCGTQAIFASKIGLSNVSVSNKLNNLVDWSQNEMETSMEVLGLPMCEVHTYFFTHLVENNSTSFGKKGEHTT